MKIKLVKFCLIFASGFFACVVFAHEVVVHQEITRNAEASAYANSSAYADFLNAISSDRSRFGKNGLAQSLVSGSAHEDDPPGNQLPDPKDGGGIRSYNHFYDPLDTTYGKGLSDGIFSGLGPIGDKRSLIGNNSFVWASTYDCIGINFAGELGFGANLNTSNVWSWPNARNYEWLGLTATNQLERQANLDNMFRAVGQVMHLLEDASQPQHVRNEQHLDSLDGFSRTSPWLSPIEEYGKEHVRDLYYGDGSALDDDDFLAAPAH